MNQLFQVYFCIPGGEELSLGLHNLVHQIELVFTSYENQKKKKEIKLTFDYAVTQFFTFNCLIASIYLGIFKRTNLNQKNH